MHRFRLAVSCAIALAATPAVASSSNWIEAEGGRIRLVTSGLPDARGRLDGVLQIDLAPGWKTYWRDPGDAGVPPSLDLSASSNIASAAFSFPPPQRFEDGGSTSSGYKQPVALPVTLSLKDGGGPITASVFVGICEAICIPVQGELSLDPAHQDEGDAALVEAARASLPRPDQPDFAAILVDGAADTIVVRADFPGHPASADLFVAGEAGYVFGVPERRVADGAALFTVPVLDRPAAKPAGAGLAYTLTTNVGAVEGLLPYP